MSLNVLIDCCGTTHVHSDVAQVVAEYNKVNGVLMVAYSCAKWHSYNKVKNGWDVSKSDKFIRIQLSGEIAPLFIARSDYYLNQATESDLSKAVTLTKIAHLLKNSAYKSNIIREVKAMVAT